MKVFKKIITVVTIITFLITLISFGYRYLVHRYISHRFTKEATSIGIIGGLDGPTAIFISSRVNLNIITMIAALLSISGFVFYLWKKK